MAGPGAGGAHPGANDGLAGAASRCSAALHMGMRGGGWWVARGPGLSAAGDCGLIQGAIAWIIWGTGLPALGLSQ